MLEKFVGFFQHFFPTFLSDEYILKMIEFGTDEEKESILSAVFIAWDYFLGVV